MKRFILFLLLIGLLAGSLTGCAAPASPAGTAAPAADPAGTPPGPSPQEEFAEEDPPPAEFVPGWTDGEIYVTLANQDCDWYPDGTGLFPSMSFRIISSAALERQDIRVTLPMETPHEIRITDLSAYYHTVDDPQSGELGEFKFWHWLLLQKPDWDYLIGLKADRAALEAWEEAHPEAAEGADVTDPEAVALFDRVLDGELYLQKYADAYEGLTPDQLPDFRVFQVDILPRTPFSEETVDHMELTLGTKTVTVPFGAWRFHAETPEQISLQDGYGLTLRNPGVMSLSGTFCDGGFGILRDAFSFTVGRDGLTVTGAQAFEPGQTLVGAHVRLLTADQTAASDYYWDLRIPLDFPAGQTVSMDLIIYSRRLLEYEFGGTAYLSLDYEVNGRPHFLHVPCFLNRSNDILETWLAVFEGCPLEKVYRYDHFAAAPVWPEIPGIWRGREWAE